VQVVTPGGSVDGRLAVYVVSYVVVTNWVVLQVLTDWALSSLKERAASTDDG
jgi:hypothetical protein